jgi:hypothetical protein
MYSDKIINNLIDYVGDAHTEFSNVVYSRDEVALANGAFPYQLLTSWCWFPHINGVYDESKVDPTIVLYGIKQWGEKIGLKIIDIETWNVYTQTDIAIPNLITAVSLWKEHTTNRVGFYRILPEIEDNYWPAVMLKRAIDACNKIEETNQRTIISDWMKANDANSISLDRYIDFVCPQCYVQYSGNQDEWKWAIGLQLLEATRLAQGKAVYPIMWYNAQSSKVALTRDEFISSLKYVLAFPGVNGIVMYDGGILPTDYKWQDIVSDVVHKVNDFKGV